MHRSGVSAYPSRIVPPLLFSVVLSPLGWQSCRTGGGGSRLFYLLALGVCVLAYTCECAYAGDAADAADDDQGDE